MSNPKEFKLTKAKRAEGIALMRKIPRVNGEKRCVFMCKLCGEISGRRFIPYGIGQGLWVNMCLCHATGNNKSMDTRATIVERKP